MSKTPRYLIITLLCGLAAMTSPATVHAERETVLKQIRLPHNYYYREMYLPQLTAGPSSLAWSADGKRLVYSMQGSLWVQDASTTTARQVTAGPGYDYQPDWSPDGHSIIFARYLDDAIELYLLDVDTGLVNGLTAGGAVNVEPRWSPDGSRIAWVSTQSDGRFRIYTGAIGNGKLSGEPLIAERRSTMPRYYYSEYDHQLSPVWSPDGTELIYVSNPENAYGTGGLWRLDLDAGIPAIAIRQEETSWKARPDWAQDGNRVIWSSYEGRQWQQLWLTTSAGGGDPIPLTYGEFDVTGARWSPDGRSIAYITNESGSTEIWIQEIPGGKKYPLEAKQREYLQPMGTLKLRILDVTGAPVPARVSVQASDGRSYAPDDAWIHADDGFDRSKARMETVYFHSPGESTVSVPAGDVRITVWRGLEHAITEQTAKVSEGESITQTLTPPPLAIPHEWTKAWQSGDVHVHMNYGGSYRNTPAHLVAQAEAEDLDVVFNLIVNKEQRVPDIAYFSPAPDPASNEKVLLQHAQEFHTSFWGHLGLLGLDDHVLLPGYSSYYNTGLASPYPDNATVADLAHAQNALVGYVHPYDAAPDPVNDARLTNELPVDVALGKVDYYEVSGFSDYRETQQVWYRLLNCGFRLAAAGGTDAMANYASLRGPVGLNRVYVMAEPGTNDLAGRRDRWLAGLKAGKSMATNGPILNFTLAGKQAGGDLSLPAGEHELEFNGFMQSIVPVDHLEVVVNGKVVKRIEPDGSRRSATFSGQLKLDASSWVLLRAWNDDASADIFDRFPYATTNPVFIEIDGQPLRSSVDADYFISWIDRIYGQLSSNTQYNDENEKQAVLSSIASARSVFESRR
ncbi:MAG: CehA/McbA family metallohydrolase [Lysobacterales bacterium]